MEKLTIVGNFTKILELLRNTECTSKEKINYFHQISDFITSPAMTSQPNYSKYCSNAICILLLFCEDLDTSVRMNAEENLNKIIRSMEINRISRILFDLLNEIKKNGNERSLKICLKLFAYYCPRLKEKNVKWYALKLLPYLQSIAKRKERDIQETLVKFMESYGVNLQVCLNDNESIKLLEVILANILSDCPVKRRCSSQICIILIENSKNKSYMANHCINACIEFLKKDVGDNSRQQKQYEKEKEQQKIQQQQQHQQRQKSPKQQQHQQQQQQQQSQLQDQKQTNTMLGVLGFFRLLFPILISENLTFNVRQIIEIYDFCLYLLNSQNHSIINASLEVINSILMRLPGNEKLVEILTNGNDSYNTNTTIDSIDDITKNNDFIDSKNEKRFLHNEFLKKRKSLKNQIFQLIEKKSNNTFNITPPPRPPKPSYLVRQLSEKIQKTETNINAAAGSSNSSSTFDQMTCNALNKKEQQQFNKNQNKMKEPNKKHLKSIFTDDDFVDNDFDYNDNYDGDTFDKRISALKTTITNDFSGALINEEFNKQEPSVDNLNNKIKISSENLFVDDDDDGLVTIPSPSYSTSKTISDCGGVTSSTNQLIGTIDKDNTLQNNIVLDDEDETIIIRTGCDGDSDDNASDSKEIKNKIKISMHQGVLKDKSKLNNFFDDIDDVDSIDNIGSGSAVATNDDNICGGESKNVNKNSFLPIKTLSKSLMMMVSSTISSASSPMDIAEEILKESGEKAYLEEKENLDDFTTISNELNETDESHMRINLSEDKSQVLSDIDNESFNSIDFESEITIDGEIQQQQIAKQSKEKDKQQKNEIEGNASVSGNAGAIIGSDWKLQKSTESIGSFFNSLLSSSHTESMTKLFRPSATKLLSGSTSITNSSTGNSNNVGENENQDQNQQLLQSTMSMTTEESVEKSEGCNSMNSMTINEIIKDEKQQQQKQEQQSPLSNNDAGMSSTPLTTVTPKRKKNMTTIEDDTISLESINSHISMFSHVSYQSSSGTQDFILKNEQDLKIIQENQQQEQQQQQQQLQQQENQNKKENFENFIKIDNDDETEYNENNKIRKYNFGPNHHQLNEDYNLDQYKKNNDEKKDSNALSKILLDKTDKSMTEKMSLMMDKKMDYYDKFDNMKNIAEISLNDNEKEESLLRQKQQQYFARSRTLSTDSNSSRKINPFNNLLSGSTTGGSFVSNNLGPYLEIGEIYDQNIISYTIRLITKKFLLTGIPYLGSQNSIDLNKSLIPDQKVLVSIKHLSLMVIGNCIKLLPSVLQLPLEFDPIELEKIREFNNIRNVEDTANSSTSTSNNSSQDLDNDQLQSLEGTPNKSDAKKDFEDPLTTALENLELEIKDDHFGECTTTEILFNYPLARNNNTSTNPSKSEIKKLPIPEPRIEENQDSKGAKPKSKFSIMNKLKPQPKLKESKSEFNTYIVHEQFESTPSVASNIDQNKPPILPRRKSPRKRLSNESPIREIQNTIITNKMSSPIKSPTKKLMALNPNRQFVSDILWFYKHSDPVLRGDIQVIIGNYLHSILKSGQYNTLLNDLNQCNEILISDVNENGKIIQDSEYFAKNSLNINRLLAILIMGFRDEIHTVVIHALTSFDKIFPLVMLKHFNNLYEMMKQKNKNKKKYKKNNNTSSNSSSTSYNNLKIKKNKNFENIQQKKVNNIQENILNLNKNNNNENNNKNEIEIEKNKNIMMLPKAEITIYSKNCDTQDTLIDEILMMIKIRKKYFYINNKNRKLKNDKSFLQENLNYFYNNNHNNNNQNNQNNNNNSNDNDNNQSKSNNDDNNDKNDNLNKDYINFLEIDNNIIIHNNDDDNDDEINIKMLLDEIRLCCHSKNWSVQNKYIDIITNFDIIVLQQVYNVDNLNFNDNDEIGTTYQRIFINEFIEFLGHDDFRVRNHAIQHLSQFIRNQCFIEANINKMKSRHQLQSKCFYNDNQYQYQKNQDQQQEQNLNQYQYWQNQGNNLSLLTKEEQDQQQQYQYYQKEQQQYEQLQQLNITNFNLVKELFNYRIFYGLSPTLGNLLNAKCLPSNQIEKLLAKVLYILTNKLMELNNKNLQIGVIAVIKTLLNEFNPIDFYEQWNEFNISSICLQFAYENYPLATDLSCQNDLIDVTTTLLSANVLNNSKTNDNNLHEILFGHIMKILNIYYHLLSNQKPILFAKSHKNDLFQNSKEVATINNYGYFGNDYLYIKIYNLLKISFDNYKIQINPDSGEKMMQLLKTCLNSLSTLLDLKEHTTISTVQETTKTTFSSVLGTPVKKSSNNQSNNTSSNNSSQWLDIKVIEEILQYLSTLINYQPVDSIVCLRQLLKFLLGRNYANRKSEYEKFIKCYLMARKQIFNRQILSNDGRTNVCGNVNNKDIMSLKDTEKIMEPGEKRGEVNEKDEEKFLQKQQNTSYGYSSIGANLNKSKDQTENIFERQKQMQNNVSDRFYQEADINLLDLFKNCMNFPLGKSKSEEDCAKHIKLFEPLVIYCLSLFMKSNAIVQRPILDLLSQLLEFNVTYSILDSKNVIFEQILRTFDLIENGIARNSTIIIMPIIRFLVNLTRQNDKKLITIPKIISLTNSLLANNLIRKCSILALKGLAFELFFNEMPKRSNSKLNKIMSTASTTTTSTSIIKNSGSSSSLNNYNNNSSTSSYSIKNSNSTNFLTNDKELNTQKEVVLDMLEKFIDYSDCSKMLVILMLWRNIWNERYSSNIDNDERQLQQQQQQQEFQNLMNEEEKNHAINVAGKRIQDNRILDKTSSIATTIGSPTSVNIFPLSSQIPSPISPLAFAMSLQNGSIFTILSKDICDGKIKINNWNEFFILDSVLKNSDKNFLLDSKIYLSLLTFFINKTVASFNDLSLATIILENVLLKAEEIYLVNHIKLYLKNQNKIQKNNSSAALKDVEQFDYLQQSYFQQDDDTQFDNQQQQQQKYQQRQYNLKLNQDEKNIFITTITGSTATNEMNYFANILYEKLKQCILTLINSHPEQYQQQHQQQQQKQQQNIGFGLGTLGTSSVIISFVNFSDLYNNNSNNENKYYHDNDIHQQLCQEFNEPESSSMYNKFSKLVVKFIKSIYMDSILKKDSLNSLLRLTLEQNNFWQKYNLNNSSYENVKVEIFRMFYILTNLQEQQQQPKHKLNEFGTNSYNVSIDDNDYNVDNDGNIIIEQNCLNKILLLEKLKNFDRNFVKRQLISEIIMKFPHPNLWSLPEIEVLLKDFMIILLDDVQTFLFNLCEIPKYRNIFVEYLKDYCNNASKDELFIILNFMNNVLTTTTTMPEDLSSIETTTESLPIKETLRNNQSSCSRLPIEIKIEIILKIRTKVQYNGVLQKLIEQIIQNEIEFHGKNIIEMILSKRNIQLNWILNGNELLNKNSKDNLSALDLSTIDENWLINQIIKYSSITNSEQFVNILYDIKSETKLKQILSTENFNIKLILKSALKISFGIMLKQFQNDCIQFNPHINYMNLNPLARVSLNILKESLDNLQNLIVESNKEEKQHQKQQQQQQQEFYQNNEKLNNELWNLSTCVIVLLENIKHIYNIGLIYIDAKFLEKFIKDQILKSETLIDSLIKFSLILSNYIKKTLEHENINFDINDDINNDISNEKESNIIRNDLDIENIQSNVINCDNRCQRSTIDDIEKNDISDNNSFTDTTDTGTGTVLQSLLDNKSNVSINSSSNSKSNYNNNNNKKNNYYSNTNYNNDNRKSIKIYTYCKCIDLLLKENLIWHELNHSIDDANTIKINNIKQHKYELHLNTILEFIHIGLIRSIGNTFFYRKYKLQKKNTIDISMGAVATVEEDFVQNSNFTIQKTALERYKIGNDGNCDADDDDSRHIDINTKYSMKECCIESEFASKDINNTKVIKENYISSENKISGKIKCDYYYNKKIILEKAVFIANVIETNCNANSENSSNNLLLDILKSIGISLLRMNNFYAYAVTPFEIIQDHHNEYFGEKNDQKSPGNRKQSEKLPSIPVEDLSDVDVLQKFVQRLSIFGFTSRQQFEEYFMTFLLLINTDYNSTIVDIHEQFQIRSICLKAILELLITYKTFPIVGNKLSSFHHTTRWSKIKCDNISTKKLHKVQLLVPGSNVFYLPNLERNLTLTVNKEDNGSYGSLYNIKNSIIGTELFQLNQYDLNFVWQLMENSNMEPDIKKNMHIRNFQYYREQSEIDFKSSSQLIFDVITVLIEQNHVLVLPNLVKFCEICENRDQVKWIRQKVLKMQETIPIDDTISHHHIIYLLCKTQSMLIPSTSDLSHLCSLISNYLKSSHVFIRNAALHGLLCLLECCSKTNTTIGKLSDELSMLRDLIIGYIIRHGIVEESSLTFSDLHTKLVWTLNFSLIEMTMKFVPDCNLLSNSIISANNLLKRTTNEEVYLCVLHGLERIVVTNIAAPFIRNKIEKLALELVKMDNERFSIPALKLLLSCVYMGSTKQLENTELSNGIVQDDPEIIIQQTDKVDVLLHCIKSSKKSAAKIYGIVLCQIVRDLVPPKEILTKVIKEFLAINQPHCEVIADIVHQVFRSAIDASFLQMLQEWLICSLPTFLNLPEYKSIWSLTVIFISASINLHLIKLFPVVISNYNEKNQYNQQRSAYQIRELQTDGLYDAEICLFVTSAKDFHSKLNSDQKQRFVEVFQQYQKQQQNSKEKYSLMYQQQEQVSSLNDGKIFQLMLESL